MEPLSASQSLPSRSGTPEERLVRRRVRRWKRRARIAGPFVGVSILFAALSLSVDLIEYEPITEPERLADRPIYHDNQNATNDQERLDRRDSLAAVSVASIDPTAMDGGTGMVNVESIDLDLDLRLPAHGGIDAPTAPNKLR